MEEVQVQLFGQLRVTCGSQVTTRFRTHKTALLLATLALRPGHPFAREDLIQTFWPDTELSAARNSLSQALSSLRAILGEALEADREMARTLPSLSADVDDFRRAAKRGDLDGALAAYSGPLLLGFSDGRVLRERDVLREELRSLLESPATTDHRWAQAWHQRDPGSELAAYHRIKLALAGDNRSDAMAALSELTKALRVVGLKPARELGELLSTSACIPTSEPLPLPHYAASFVGRTKERARLAEMLAPSSESVLLSLLGIGGTGKTRLAAQVAGDLASFYAGRIWFVPLAEALTAIDFWRIIIRSAGLTATDVNPQQQVKRGLEPGSTLIVLDNCEQLVELPEVLLAVTDLLSVEGTKVFATSRRRLGIAGEIEMRLSPLQVPAMEMDVLASESGALFCSRAQAVRPDFQISEANASDIARLCQALDGIPLAIELAAARAQVLTPRQMLERLDQRLDSFVSRERGAEERHRTLRQTIDWSFQLLPPPLAEFFVRLSVFGGGWTLELAEEVLDEPQAMDWLSQLVDASLVTSEESGSTMRFRMLETIHVFAATHLRKGDQVRQKHAQAMLAFAESRETNLAIASPDDLMALEGEHDNLRVAMETAISEGNFGTCARFVAALWRFWHLRGYIKEGRQWVERLLEVAGPTHGAAEHGAGRLAYLQGDYDQAEEHFKVAQALSVGQPRSLAQALSGLGSVAYERGDFGAALGQFNQSLGIFRELNDPPSIAAALNWIGIVRTDTREYDLATAALEESYAIRKRIGDRPGIARALTSLGIVRRQQGDLLAAKQHYEEALAIHQVIGDRRAEGGCLSNLGFVETKLANFESATQHLLRSIELLELVGDKWGLSAALANRGNLEVARGNFEMGMVLLRDSLRLRIEIGNQQGVALSLEGLGLAYVITQDAARALGCFELARQKRTQIGAPLAPSDEADLATRWQEAITTLGPDGVERVYADLDKLYNELR